MLTSGDIQSNMLFRTKWPLTNERLVPVPTERETYKILYISEIELGVTVNILNEVNETFG